MFCLPPLLQPTSSSLLCFLPLRTLYRLSSSICTFSCIPSDPLFYIAVVPREDFSYFLSFFFLSVQFSHPPSLSSSYCPSSYSSSSSSQLISKLPELVTHWAEPSSFHLNPAFNLLHNFSPSLSLISAVEEGFRSVLLQWLCVERWKDDRFSITFLSVFCTIPDSVFYLSTILCFVGENMFWNCKVCPEGDAWGKGPGVIKISLCFREQKWNQEM